METHTFADDEQGFKEQIPSSKTKRKSAGKLAAATLVAREAARTSGITEDEFIGPKRDEAALREFAIANGLWLSNFTEGLEGSIIGSGVEAVVYLSSDSSHVLKVNSGIQHGSWLDFLHRISAHNVYFPEASYEIVGFTNVNSQLAVILKQPAVQISGSAPVEAIKADLELRGFEFEHIHYAFDSSMGVILRDLHHENAVINEFENVVYIDPLIQFTKDSEYLKVVDEVMSEFES